MHFLTLVIGDEPEEQLTPYEYGLELPLHLYKTKLQLIADKRRDIERYKKNVYDVFMQDPQAYRASNTKEHVDYLENKFPEELAWTDEQVYEEALSFYKDLAEAGIDGTEIRGDGSVWHTSSDNVKYDWCEMGGRYLGRLQLKDKSQDAPLFKPDPEWIYSKEGHDRYKRLKEEGRCDQARVRDISNLEEISCYAVVKDGKWYERGQVGPFGTMIDEDDYEAWDETITRLLSTLSPDTLLTVYDCHD